MLWSGASDPVGVGAEHVQTDSWGSTGTWEIARQTKRH